MCLSLLPCIAAAASSDYAYSYSDSGTLEYVSPSTDEDLPARWKAPESLKEHSYSTASDVWALGVLVYEVLTYGCIPYRNLSDDEEVISLVSILFQPFCLPFFFFVLSICFSFSLENRDSSFCICAIKTEAVERTERQKG